MSTQIVPFEFGGNQIRPATLNGAPALVLSDIAKVLGYRDAATAGRILRDHHKGYAEVRTPGGAQQMLVVTEQGFNRLVIRSNAANAEQVQDFITDEVMPQLARTGSFKSQHALPQSFSAALRELAATVEQNEALEAKIEADAPKIAYHERFVGERSDIITVDVFAGQFGSTGPKVRELLHEKNIASRKIIGQRWSKSKQEMEPVYEWRARQGRATTEWFDLLPQNDAPRLHNGQVRQTMYVRQFHAEALAGRLGLVAAGTDLGEVA